MIVHPLPSYQLTVSWLTSTNHNCPVNEGSSFKQFPVIPFCLLSWLQAAISLVIWYASIESQTFKCLPHVFVHHVKHRSRGKLYVKCRILGGHPSISSWNHQCRSFSLRTQLQVDSWTTTLNPWPSHWENPLHICSIQASLDLSHWELLQFFWEHVLSSSESTFFPPGLTLSPWCL